MRTSSAKAKCYFCQFEWYERFWDGYFRQRENWEDECPRCGLPQNDKIKLQNWQIHFRKFSYGIVNIQRRQELEDFIKENFRYVGHESKFVHKDPVPLPK